MISKPSTVMVPVAVPERLAFEKWLLLMVNGPPGADTVREKECDLPLLSGPVPCTKTSRSTVCDGPAPKSSWTTPLPTIVAESSFLLGGVNALLMNPSAPPKNVPVQLLKNESISTRTPLDMKEEWAKRNSCSAPDSDPATDTVPLVMLSAQVMSVLPEKMVNTWEPLKVVLLTGV